MEKSLQPTSQIFMIIIAFSHQKAGQNEDHEDESPPKPQQYEEDAKS